MTIISQLYHIFSFFTELPEKPKIFDEADKEVAGVAGPYIEDTSLKLTCVVSGGKIAVQISCVLYHVYSFFRNSLLTVSFNLWFEFCKGIQVMTSCVRNHRKNFGSRCWVFM